MKRNKTKFPQPCRLCDKCRDVYIPPWLAEELNHYPYPACRNDLIFAAYRDLCKDCARSLIVAYDKANGYTVQ